MVPNVMPDDILENLVCSSCKKYLSVKPIKIYPDRKIRCGRCVEDGDGGVESLYGLFAEEVLFPCINRYEDCNQFLKYSEVQNHEKYCRVGYYPCLVCNNFNGSAYDLFMHFKITHENNVRYSNEFPINIKSESMDRCYLYCQRNFLFMINIKCDKICEELCLSLTFIGPKQKGNYLKHQFDISSLDDSDIKYSTMVQNCLPLGTTTTHHIIKFNELFNREKVFLCNIKMNTSECEGLIGLCQLLYTNDDQQPNQSTKDNIRSNNSSAVQVAKPPLINKPIGFLFPDKIKWNNEIEFYDIVESQFRLTSKRKVTLDATNIYQILPEKVSNEIIEVILVSEDQTSILFGSNETNLIEFELICGGCKENLPVVSYIYEQEFRSLTLNICKTVYNCVCPHNVVCENCFNNWNFKTCRNGHPYMKEIVRSTVLAMLHYESWKQKGVFKMLDIKDDLNVDSFKVYCKCRGRGLLHYSTYLDFIKSVLNLKFSVLDVGFLSYHILQCSYVEIDYLEQLQWLLPFSSHSIPVRNLLAKTYVTVANTLIIIEKFENDLTTAFKVKFYEVQNKNIVSILKFASYGNYKIFKGDFIIWNTEITSQTLISFRII